MWRGIDLSTWTVAALECIKKRYKEVEFLLQGGSVDENELLIFRTNEQLYVKITKKLKNILIINK